MSASGTFIDVEVVIPGRRPRLAPAVVAMASGLDLVAVAIVLMAHGRPFGFLVAGGLHLLAVAPLVLGGGGGLGGSGRLLAAALALTLPVVGAPMAALALGTVGRAELAAPMPDADVEAPPPDPARLRRVAEALPTCEALLATSVEERRAILAAITRRGDRASVALLRWALTTSGNSELAVEAALALEELRAGFDGRMEGARAGVASAPTVEAALGAGEIVAAGLESGIVEPALVGTLAAEARRYLALAAELDPTRAFEVAARRARLELMAMRPDDALRLLDQALAAAPPGARRELFALREEALLASHDLPWEGSSMMATSRSSPALVRSVPPPPPPSSAPSPASSRPPIAIASGSRPRRITTLAPQRLRRTIS